MWDNVASIQSKLADRWALRSRRRNRVEPSALARDREAQGRRRPPTSRPCSRPARRRTTSSATSSPSTASSTAPSIYPSNEPVPQDVGEAPERQRDGSDRREERARRRRCRRPRPSRRSCESAERGDRSEKELPSRACGWKPATAPRRSIRRPCVPPAASCTGAMWRSEGGVRSSPTFIPAKRGDRSSAAVAVPSPAGGRAEAAIALSTSRWRRRRARIRSSPAACRRRPRRPPRWGRSRSSACR